MSVSARTGDGGLQQVAIGGYAIVKAAPSKDAGEWAVGDDMRWEGRQPVLVEAPGNPGYRPIAIDAPGACRAFAAIDPDDEGQVVAFASRFGMLGDPRYLRPDSSAAGPFGIGEPVATWRMAIRAVGACLEVMDLLRAGDSKGLLQLFTWGGPQGRWRYQSRARKAGVPVDGEWVEPESGAAYDHTGMDPRPAARLWLRRRVNRALEGRVRVGLRIDPRDGQERVTTAPADMVAALWFQLAVMITGGREQRACQNCGRFFEVGNPDLRTSKKRLHCSEACKSAFYRKRKAVTASKATKGLKGKGARP